MRKVTISIKNMTARQQDVVRDVLTCGDWSEDMLAQNPLFKETVNGKLIELTVEEFVGYDSLILTLDVDGKQVDSFDMIPYVIKTDDFEINIVE